MKTSQFVMATVLGAALIGASGCANKHQTSPNDQDGLAGGAFDGASGTVTGGDSDGLGSGMNGGLDGVEFTTSTITSELSTGTATANGVDFDSIYAPAAEVVTDGVVMEDGTVYSDGSYVDGGYVDGGYSEGDYSDSTVVTDGVVGYYDENGNFVTDGGYFDSQGHFIAYDAQQNDLSVYDYSEAADNRFTQSGSYTGSLDTRVIYFGYNDDSIANEAYNSLRMHADYLKQNPNARLRLEGHADERGTRDYNIALSERRANAVKRYLQIQGVSPSQLEVISYGEEKPAELGNNEFAWSKNRRVELVYATGAPY